MSYALIIPALHARYNTVTALAAKPILAYEPTAIHAFPTLYSLLAGVERGRAGQVTSMRYTVLSRLVFRWQDNEQAELELQPYVNSIPHAIDQDPTLGGAADHVRITRIEAIFVTIGSLFRALDFYVDVLEKAPYQTGGI